MKPHIFCLLAFNFCFAIAFSQADTTQSTISFAPKKFNNPFTNLNKNSDPAPFTIRNLPGNLISFVPKSNYSNRTVRYQPSARPVWRDVASFAGQIALSAYADKRNMNYAPPKR